MKLPVNEAPLDRAIRIVLGFGLAIAAVSGTFVAPWLYVAWVVSALLLVTGITGFCPLYALLRVSTVRRPH